MTQKRATVRICALTFALAFCLGLAMEGAAAGEARGATIPPRLQKVKEGDWIFYKTVLEDDGVEYSKETATAIEKVENDYIVHYTLEEFDAAGKPKGKPQEVARFLSDERDENADMVKSLQGAKADRRKVKIDGKTIDATVFVVKEDDTIQIEYWFSDDISIDGKVGMVVMMPDEKHSYVAFETLAFGDAKTKFDIRKYIGKK